MIPAPGIIPSESDNVIPDVVWVSQERLALIEDEAGHLTGFPELIVEVLSPGEWKGMTSSHHCCLDFAALPAAFSID